MQVFFICESGPMGGIQIVWIGASDSDAREWMRLAANQDRELYMYERVASNAAAVDAHRKLEQRHLAGA